MSKVGNEAYERMLPGGSFAPPHPHEPQHFETKEFAGLQPYWPLLIPYVGCICCPCIVTANHRLVLEEDEAVDLSSKEEPMEAEQLEQPAGGQQEEP